MPISYFHHKGMEMMFADYRECREAKQQLALLEEAANMIKSKGQVRLLVDYNGVSGGIEYMTRLKELGNTILKEHMKCSAVLGITGLKQVLFNGYNRATRSNNVRAFKNREEAIDWLADF